MEITRGHVQILENPNFLYILEARLRVLSLSKRDKSVEETIPRSYQKNAMLLISRFFFYQKVNKFDKKNRSLLNCILHIHVHMYRMCILLY